MSAPPRTLAAEIREATGINAATCYQCGKCSAGCPMASESDLRPHNVMRLVMQDRREDALADESIWLCLTCETCSRALPQRLRPGARHRRRPRDEHRGAASPTCRARSPPSTAPSSSRSARNGRLHEMGMVMEYKLRSGDLMKDVTNAPAMSRRGKLSLRPDRIDGIAEIKRIFAKCVTP